MKAQTTTRARETKRTAQNAVPVAQRETQRERQRETRPRNTHSEKHSGKRGRHSGQLGAKHNTGVALRGATDELAAESARGATLQVTVQLLTAEYVELMQKGRQLKERAANEASMLLCQSDRQLCG